jgi:EAL domain-containing protein (putative c-di-GMP-specific phosphodiesterase class I)
LELVRALGCVEMQGYLFSPPRPLAQLLPLIEPQRRKLARTA